MNFEQALSRMKDGEPMRRGKWSDKGAQVQVAIPREVDPMTTRYLYLNTDEGTRVPFTVTQADLFAEDWESAVGIPDSPGRTPDIAEVFDDR